MHVNILRRIFCIRSKKLFLVLFCFGSVFICNRLLNSNDTMKIEHKEILNIREFIDPDLTDTRYRYVEVKKPRKFLKDTKHYVENCGMPAECPHGTFPVHLYTAKAEKDTPKLCVGGYYVFDTDLNNPGRGLNIALVDSNRTAAFQVGHFDTYESDPTQLEMVLEKHLQTSDILIIFTNDEASLRFSGLLVNILQSLGSGLVQNIKFRSSWYIITQKGIKGFTPFEKLSTANNHGNWGDVYDERLCIPTIIEGMTIHPDILAKENKQRRDFCEKSSGYHEFCSGLLDASALYPTKIDNESMVNHPIFSVPIIVLSGTSLHSLPLTLETLLRQPGINPRMISVFYLPALSEAAKLAELFVVNSVLMTTSYLFEDQVEFAFNHTVESYPDASHLIFLEDDLILSPDFLSYMATMMPLLEQDPTLYSISAWNDNGYKGTSSNLHISYRVENFPGLGFMISKTTYIRQMRGHMKECCSNRPWVGWRLPLDEETELVVPDVSRVLHRPYEGLGPKTNMLEALFNRERITSQSSAGSMENSSEVILKNYEQQIEKLLHTAILLDMRSSQLKDCLEHKHTSGNYFTPKSKQRQSFVLYYEQNGPNDLETLKSLCKCFGLFHADDEPPRGLHRGLLRFTIDGNDMMFVGSSSPYYQLKPSYHQPLESV